MIRFVLSEMYTDIWMALLPNIDLATLAIEGGSCSWSTAFCSSPAPITTRKPFTDWSSTVLGPIGVTVAPLSANSLRIDAGSELPGVTLPDWDTGAETQELPGARSERPGIDR